MSEIDELLEVQLDLEAESRAISRTRYRNKRSAPWMDGFGPEQDEASLPPGRALVRSALDPTTSAIEAFLAEGRAGKAGRRNVSFSLLKPHQPDPRALAYLTLRCTMQAGVAEGDLKAAAKTVARAIQGHLEDAIFQRSNPAGWRGMQRNLAKGAKASAKRQRAVAAIREREGATLYWSQKEQLLLGTKLIELAIEATALFELRHIKERVGKTYRQQYLVTITDEAMSWLERQHERCELLDPLPLPMVVQPRPWTTPTDGGYLQPPIGNRLVRSHSAPYAEELEHLVIGSVYDAVNAIQGTAWRINRRVLEVLERLTADGGGLAGLPRQFDESLPPRPIDLEKGGPDEKEWNRRRSEVHARNASGRGKRLSIAQQLWVARKLVDFPSIYFPHSLDWRGRVYPIPQAGPHPQAGDTGRSLLEFAEGKTLGSNGARWLAIHTANSFGIDKASFDERVAWTEGNSAAIVDSAEDPLDGSRFWATADKPWAALAACLEWAGYQREGEGFVSRIPIAIDGSNSGLQHFTALLRDSVAAPHVNLTHAERPGDIYALVAARVQAIVDGSNDPLANPWKRGKITRSIVKAPCMTYVYSATTYAMTEQIVAALRKLDEQAAANGHQPHLDGADNFASAVWLASRLYKLIGEAVPAAASGMKWLRGAAAAINSSDVPLWWTTPAGLPIMQRYPHTKVGKTEVTFRGKRMQLGLAEDASSRSLIGFLEGSQGAAMDSKQTLSGISPNFIHSLDAAHLMLTINAAAGEGIADLAVIHDSFGTYAADTDDLSRILRETFVTMYEGDPLEAFRDQLLEQIDDPTIRDQVPPLPSKGNFDLHDVLDATYMFA